MYIVRDIFHLHFGHFKEVKNLMEKARQQELFPKAQELRVLTDFTGDSYRLILESGYATLADYESSLTGTMATDQWQAWYAEFKSHMMSSHREILKVVF